MDIFINYFLMVWGEWTFVDTSSPEANIRFLWSVGLIFGFIGLVIGFFASVCDEEIKNYKRLLFVLTTSFISGFAAFLGWAIGCCIAIAIIAFPGLFMFVAKLLITFLSTVSVGFIFTMVYLLVKHVRVSNAIERREEDG